MARITYREFTILTQEDCDKSKDGKTNQRYPVQVRDRLGYHFCYASSEENAQDRINAWWERRAPHASATE